MIDQIVQEIRDLRDAHAKRFNYDLDAICDNFITHQQKCGHKIVKLKPKKLANKSLKKMGK